MTWPAAGASSTKAWRTPPRALRPARAKRSPPVPVSLDPPRGFCSAPPAVSATLKTSSQRAALAAEIEPMLAKETKGRQRAGGKKAGRSRPQQVQEILPEPIPQARDDAAKIARTNGRYVSDAKTVKEKAPELFEAVK